MLATIKIKEKDVTLKASLFSNILYKTVFHKNMLSDMIEIENKAEKITNCEDEVQKIDMSQDVIIVGFQVIWTLAKSSDNNIPPFETWLQDLDMGDINFNECYKIASQLVSDSQRTSPKNA